MKKIVILFTFTFGFVLPLESANKLFSKVALKISKYKPTLDVFKKAKTAKQESADEDEDKNKEKSEKSINCRRLLFSPYSTLLHSTLKLKRHSDNRFKNPSFPRDDNQSK